jgi:hypothetical protein
MKGGGEIELVGTLRLIEAYLMGQRMAGRGKNGE